MVVSIDKELLRVRRDILSNNVSYASVLVPLTFKKKSEVNVMATDGRYIYYSEKWITDLFDKEDLDYARKVIYVVTMHELKHVLNCHHTRRGDRDPKGWNIATDFAINSDLIEECKNDLGYTAEYIFTKMNALVDNEGRFRNDDGTFKSAEHIYSILASNKPEDSDDYYMPQQASGGNAQASSDSGDSDQSDEEKQDSGNSGSSEKNPLDSSSFGEVTDFTDEDGNPVDAQSDKISEEQQRISDAIITAKQQMKGIGDDSGYSRMSALQKAQSTPVDFSTSVAQHLTFKYSTDNDMSFHKPNRRLLHTGIYYPSHQPSHSGVLAIGFDISGSMSHEERCLQAEALDNILKAFPQIEKVKVCYINTIVQRINNKDEDTDTFNADDYWDEFDVAMGETINVRDLSGGGTRVDPFFNLIDQTNHEVFPDCAIYFTDGYVKSDMENNPPQFPVLWATTDYTGNTPNFAECVQVDVNNL